MHIISCERCGVMLDMDRIPRPRTIDPHTEEITENAVLRFDELEPAIRCPACDTLILYENGEIAE